jgi:prolycopene isomerase
MDPVDQFHLPDGSRFAVPADYDTYLAQLKGQFPQEAEAIDRFFQDVKKLYLLGVLRYFRNQETNRLQRYQALTVRDALDQHFVSDKLKLLLTADCPHWGAPPCRTSFVFDSMLRLSYFLGNYYPQQGSQAFADELARHFEQQGGHILMKSEVSRIATSGGTATGVELQTGPQRARKSVRLAAGAVVSNADLRQTVHAMLPAGILPPDYLQHIDRLRPTFSCFMTHLGVRGVDTELLRQLHGYYWDQWDADQVGGGAFRFKLFVPTLYEPSMAPAGGHVLVVQKVIEMDYDAVQDWTAHKLSVERYILSELEKLLPDLAGRVVVRLSASARTSFRYTRNYQGAMLGWEMSPDQLGDGRPDIRTPVRNLFLVGQWTRPGGGITPVVVSALQTARCITGGSAETPTEPIAD